MIDNKRHCMMPILGWLFSKVEPLTDKTICSNNTQNGTGSRTHKHLAILIIPILIRNTMHKYEFTQDNSNYSKVPHSIQDFQVWPSIKQKEYVQVHFSSVPKYDVCTFSQLKTITISSEPISKHPQMTLNTWAMKDDVICKIWQTGTYGLATHLPFLILL